MNDWMSTLTGPEKKAFNALVQATPGVDRACVREGHMGSAGKDESVMERFFVSCGGKGFRRQVDRSDLMVHGIRVELKELYDWNFMVQGLSCAYLPHELWKSFHGHANGGPTPIAVLRVMHQSPPDRYLGHPLAGDPSTFVERARSQIDPRLGPSVALEQPGSTYFHVVLDGARLDKHAQSCFKCERSSVVRRSTPAARSGV